MIRLSGGSRDFILDGSSMVNSGSSDASAGSANMLLLVNISVFSIAETTALLAGAAAADEDDVDEEVDVEAVTLAGGKEAAEFMEQDRFNLV